MSLLIALATLASIAVFQTAKRWINPDITLLENKRQNIGHELHDGLG